MKKAFFALILAILYSFTGNSQALLRDSSLAITSFQFGYSPAFTIGMLSNKVNMIHNICPSFSYKNTKNWLFQVQLNLLLGNKSLENETASMIYSEIGVPINTEGRLEEVRPRFQGFNFQIDAGKLLKPSSHNKNSGIYGLIGLGFFQHKIKFVYTGQLVPQLEDPYVKGYDRLTNGLAVTQFLGYRHYSNRNNLNYQIGLEVVEGFTKNRRTWNYDTFGPDNTQRLDIYFGLKFAIILPFYGVSY